jgi:nitrogenase subunit NifH
MPSAKGKVNISIRTDVYKEVKLAAIIWARRNHLSEERIVTKYIESVLSLIAREENEREKNKDSELARRADLAYESFLMESVR